MTSSPRSGPSRPGRRASQRRTERTSRPSQHRHGTAHPTRSTAAADARAHRRPVGLTGRAVLLGALVCSLVLLLAYPITEYVDQQQHIDELEQQVAEKQHAVDELTAQQEQLQDPAYIEQQARSRLKYVMPGDTVYIVVDEGADDPHSPSSGQPNDDAESESWYDTLAESVEVADGG